MRSSPCSRLSRRARARTSVGVSAPVSSMYDRRALHLTDGTVDARPLLIAEHARAQVSLVDAAERRDHAKRELLARHFHAEDADASLGAAKRRVLGDIDGKRRLAHRGTTCDDDQVAFLQPCRHLIELVEPRRKPGELALRLMQQIESIDHRAKLVLERKKPGPRLLAALRNLEHPALGIVDDRARVASFRIVGARSDLTAHLNQAPQNGAFAHRVGIGADVGGARGIAYERGQVDEASCFLREPLALEPLGQRDGIARLATSASGQRWLRRSVDGRADRSRLR